MSRTIVPVFCTDFMYILRKKWCNMEIHLNEGALRVALIVFSIMFGILSAFLIGLGVAYSSEIKWPEKYADMQRLTEMPVFLIIIGSASLVLSIVGCYCAKSYRRKLFLLFIVAMCLVLALETFVAIISFNYDSGARSQRTLKLMSEKLNLVDAKLYFKKIEDHQVLGNGSAA